MIKSNERDHLINNIVEYVESSSNYDEDLKQIDTVNKVLYVVINYNNDILSLDSSVIHSSSASSSYSGIKEISKILFVNYILSNVHRDNYHTIINSIIPTNISIEDSEELRELGVLRQIDLSRYERRVDVALDILLYSTYKINIRGFKLVEDTYGRAQYSLELLKIEKDLQECIKLKDLEDKCKRISVPDKLLELSKLNNYREARYLIIDNDSFTLSKLDLTAILKDKEVNRNKKLVVDFQQLLLVPITTSGDSKISLILRLGRIYQFVVSRQCAIQSELFERNSLIEGFTKFISDSYQNVTQANYSKRDTNEIGWYKYVIEHILNNNTQTMLTKQQFEDENRVEQQVEIDFVVDLDRYFCIIMSVLPDERIPEAIERIKMYHSSVLLLGWTEEELLENLEKETLTIVNETLVSFD